VAHTPGLRVVLPATPADAFGLLASAIESDDPVVVMEHKLLYGQKGPAPESRYRVPLGKAEIKRPGTDLTLIGCSRMTQVALQAAEVLTTRGVNAEVVDLRSLAPLDRETILESVARTRRAVVVDEGVIDYGVTAEIAALVSAELFGQLLAPVGRVGAWPTPIPFSPPLEKAVIPQVEDVVAAAVKCVAG